MVNSYVVVIDHRQVNVDKWAISIDEDIVPLILCPSPSLIFLWTFFRLETYLSCFSNIEVRWIKSFVGMKTGNLICKTDFKNIAYVLELLINCLDVVIAKKIKNYWWYWKPLKLLFVCCLFICLFIIFSAWIDIKFPVTKSESEFVWCGINVEIMETSARQNPPNLTTSIQLSIST